MYIGLRLLDSLAFTLQGAQLVQLVQLLPEAASEERVELCSCFWARLTDRAKTWSDVMRCLTKEQQVRQRCAALHCMMGCPTGSHVCTRVGCVHRVVCMGALAYNAKHCYSWMAAAYVMPANSSC
jgi:hypothetical protein